MIISDWDNSYNIPDDLEEQFLTDCIYNFEEWTDEWFTKCNEFDKKYWEYQI